MSLREGGGEQKESTCIVIENFHRNTRTNERASEKKEERFRDWNVCKPVVIVCEGVRIVVWIKSNTKKVWKVKVACEF